MNYSALAGGALALASTFLLASCPLRAATDPDLEAVRAATERFRDIKVAQAEGYISPPGNVCETAANMGMKPEMGGMGIHYVRPDLLGITAPPNPRVDGNGVHTDFNKPAILIYEPLANGDMQLVAVENLVFEKSWKAAGNGSPPSFQGQPYDYMKDDPATAADEAHGFEPHYDRHVWLFKENKNGMFAQFNPAVSCAHGPSGRTHAH